MPAKVMASRSQATPGLAPTRAASRRTVPTTKVAVESNTNTVAAAKPAGTLKSARTPARSTASSLASSSTKVAATSSRARPAASSTSTATTSTASSRRTAPSSQSLASSAITTTTASTSSRPALIDRSAGASLQTWTESQILEALALPTTCPACLPHYLLHLLDVTASDLELALDHSVKFSSAEKLVKAKAIYFAKQIVNAGLACIGQLTSAAWSAQSSTHSAAATSTSKSGVTNSKASAPAKLPSARRSVTESDSVLAAINLFRIACRFLLLKTSSQSKSAPGNGKEREIETIILRTSSKIRALQLDTVAYQDVVYLSKLLLSSEQQCGASGILRVPLLQSDNSPWSTACRALMVELQGSNFVYHLDRASTSDLTVIETELKHNLGPLHWQIREREQVTDVRLVDRLAYSIERSISKCLQRLDVPNDLANFNMRATALYFLVQVSDIDIDAFWERAARIGGACLKVEQTQGRQLAVAFDRVQEMFEQLVARAAAIDENKVRGPGFTKFCEYWVSFAKKANSSAGIDRATAALGGSVTLAQQSESSPTTTMVDEARAGRARGQERTEQEMVTLCASLTSTVLVLDDLIGNKTVEALEQKLEASTSLITSIGSWPADMSSSTQSKLHRVLDRISRRVWTKLSTLGVNSKGQSRGDDTSSGHIDELARACLSLLDSLYSLGEPPKSPATSEALLALDAQVSDIIHGRRILANKLFSPENKASRDQALKELQRCQAMLALPLSLRALPPAVLSEQLRLLSSSFYNPAGILYNKSEYAEAAVYLKHAAQCDLKSVGTLGITETAQKGDLDKRREGVTKKLEFVAVALRLSGQKEAALQAYREVFASISDNVQRHLTEAVGTVGIDEAMANAVNKGVATLVKSVVDLSVFDMSLDLDPDSGSEMFTHWLLQDNRFSAAMRGTLLEHAANLLESRSHLHGAGKALSNVQRAILLVYTAEDYPLRRARTLIKQLELEVLSQRLALTCDEFERIEAEALRCLTNAPACDTGLQHYQAQYHSSLLLISALAQRLRRPFENPAPVAEKVEQACTIIAGAWKASETTSRHDASPLAAAPALVRRTPASAAATPTTRKTLSRRAAPPQAKATALPVTPVAKASKPDFAAISTIARSPRIEKEVLAGKFDRVDHYCRLLEIVQDAFATLALTRCSVELLKVLRYIGKRAMPADSGSEVFCRASTDLAQAYLALGKISRAATVLQQAMAGWPRSGATQDKTLSLSQDTKFRCLMVQTELMAQDGDLDGAERVFEEALSMAKPPSKGGRDIQSSLEKLKTRERQAISYSACATIQLGRGNLAGAIDSTTMAVRQLIRQSGTLASISRKAQEAELDNSAPASDVMPASELSDANASRDIGSKKDSEEQRLPAFSSTVFSGYFWRSSKILMASYLRLSQLHAIRGSGLDAEVYAGECIDFATSMQFSLPLAQGLIHRGEVRLQLSRTEAGQEDLSRCLEVLQETWIPEVITLACVQGDCLTRIEQLGEALRSYTSGEATLQSLSTTFGELENMLASPARSKLIQRSSLTPATRPRLSASGVDFVLPELRGKLLRRQAWIWQLMGQSEQGEAAISKALTVQDGLRSIEARVDQYVLEGRIALRRALEHLKGDHFFSMFPEAAISIPMATSLSVRALASASYSNQAISEDTVRAALNMLTPADAAFRQALSHGALSSHSLLIREAFASLAQVYSTQASLGKSIRTAANKATILIDRASSVGIRRNLLVSIANKLKDKSDLEVPEWPTLREAASVSRESQQDDAVIMEDDLPSRLAKLKIHHKSASDEVSRKDHPVPAYWKAVQLRHEQAHQDLDADETLLPQNWTVISISSMGCGSDSLVLTRQEGGGGEDGCRAKEATVYNLPLHRQSQREGGDSDAEEQLTLKAAQEKLVEIVRLSNDGIHGVRDVQSLDARRQWWTARHQLDDELRDLLQAIQDTWLGGFKGVFADPCSDVQAKAALRSHFEKIVRRACFPTANKRPNKLKLDDAVFECFAGMPADCTDEDLEDLVHYVMDSLQFSGFQVAVDEVDLDETAMDLRSALDEHRGKRTQVSPSKNAFPYVALQNDASMDDQHIFLVLDRETAVFPWESMPILRGRAVSRIPSMAFLQDRIQLAKIYHCLPGVDAEEPSTLQKGKQAPKSKSRSPTKASSSRQVDPEAAWKIALRNGKLFSLSKRKTFYLLNPGGDLVQSQERFEPWLTSRSSTSAWKGIVGRQPIVNELPEALTESDLFLYFGHGGAEQFVRATRVRELSRCAVAMLWGCSSAVLQDNGEFDRTGTPLNYMCAGSPAMVGNLWDMTDRELDSVCEGVFSRLGLMQASERVEVRKAARNLATDSNGQLRASRGCKAMSLVRAVGESRDDCKLPYLTGAAAVVYGVPVYWADDDDTSA